MATPLAAIFGCAGPQLTEDEKKFFRGVDPLGFILFARNIVDPDQVRRLTADLRNAIGRDDAPILIDQEGGRVQRLKPPHWRAARPAADFGRLYATDRQAAEEAVRLNHRLLAADLAGLGINVDCAPVIDVPQADAHDVIGDRAFARDPAVVSALGRAAMDGLLDGGVLPVVKHMPGHGRARADSHHELPRVSVSLEDLEKIDFAPFRALADAAWAMTAHVVYDALDASVPATCSRTVIDGTIRGRIGFQGFLISDDLSMNALAGDFRDRAKTSLDAGCDAVLHCNGERAEMESVAAGSLPLTASAQARFMRGQSLRRKSGPFDAAAAVARVDALLARGASA